MKILAMDTSNQPMTVALSADGVVIDQRVTNEKRNHSLQLLPYIDEMMHDAGWQPTDLNRIVVAEGPGSYTGVRIGVTTAKTLAATLHIELVGVSSLQTLAANIEDATSLVVPIFDARNQNMYSGVYLAGKNVWADRHNHIDDLVAYLATTTQAIMVIGEYANFVDILTTTFGDRVQFAPENDNLPNGGRLAELGANMPPIENVHTFVPNYLRVSQAEAEWQAKHPNETGNDYVEEV
ncbi:tRNA (adenosine(37)-N6)-threonylcarbamoyltransferase complex dimerization subunit type 1 TsaB [Periweissella cryptocerci]|uniref:tRNA (Adenosine(37)-N6)-threonylcarbamoyltransferase complex dimerization subunit type 1 TsaB n=1 Tax=Periweissella cryptocerci TaxID=2506420 RepID=A0A4P6YUV1_9LACO|nr:tRNA (adenosine(37)-N6)-threonylcarbamoyltransferase complex dimerization subunit type 1 TsaB [Periweissella cryptocerci]